MKKNIFVSTTLAAVLGFSTLATGNVYAASTAKAAEALSEFNELQGTPADLGVANDERLIEMLKKEGKLAKNAGPAEAQKALKTFMQNKAASNKRVEANDPNAKKHEHSLQDKASNNGLTSGNGNKLGQTKGSTVAPVENDAFDGEVRKDKVLVLAIDFPDYKTGSITPEESNMFYEDYPTSHFEDMVFGDNGYKGPNGETFVSMKQYYEQQSGGSYTFDGQIAGWYTADNPAAYYGGNYPGPDDSDRRARSLVYEALKKAGKDPSIDLSEYDAWDRDDYDGDGVYNEPDGIIDHLMVVHAGVGEEAGGGKLGGDAIWSHRSSLGLVAVPGGSSNSNRFGGLLGASDYTIEPEDGAGGVFAHEYGHDLGLPDEYDTQYSGAGEAVSYWSIMSSGSWAGKVPGTEPTAFSPYAKELLQAGHGGNWLTGTTLNEKNITATGATVLIDENATKGSNNDTVRVDLPDKATSVNTPFSGTKEYFSGKGDELDNSMFVEVDLTNATTAVLNFKTWYDIEVDWDYASVKVNGEAIKGNITTDTDPHEQNPGHGITGSSNGWIDASFDLSAYAGQKVTVELNYWTDVAAINPGFYADDIVITADGQTIVSDDAESTSAFTLEGFTQDNGKVYSDRYYLLDWRSHNGVDQGLSHIRRGASLMSFDKGLVVWYVDTFYTDNWTGLHPGEGFLGVVDADQHTNFWSNGIVGSTRYQLNDAAFSLNKSSKLYLDYKAINGLSLMDNFTQRAPLFDDSADYSNPGLVDAGRNVPNYGLKFRVTGESVDGSVGKVQIYK